MYYLWLTVHTHLCWRAFMLWKKALRICQWILGCLDGLFWKSIVSKILTGSVLRRSFFFIFGAPKNFLGPKKTLFSNKFLGGPKIDFLKKLPVNYLETIDFQSNHSWESKIHWQILVNILHNLNVLQQRFYIATLL